MNLITMVDFVFKQSEPSIDSHAFYFLCHNYAQFLKQPLKLWMFIPCDEDGNVLEEPIYSTDHSDDCYCSKCEQETLRCDIEQIHYRKAKERVLFKEFELYGNYLWCKDFMFIMTCELENKTVESIIDECLSVQLTQTALKQIGL